MIIKIDQQPVEAPAAELETNPTTSTQERQADIDDTIQSLINDPEIDMLYREVKSVRDQVDLVRINDETIKQLRNQVSEYLNSFVLLGYDLHGRRILVQHTPKQSHADSIQKYLEHVTNSSLIFSNAIAQRQQETSDDDDD